MTRPREDTVVQRVTRARRAMALLGLTALVACGGDRSGADAVATRTTSTTAVADSGSRSGGGPSPVSAHPSDYLSSRPKIFQATGWFREGPIGSRTRCGSNPA